MRKRKATVNMLICFSVFLASQLAAFPADSAIVQNVQSVQSAQNMQSVNSGLHAETPPVQQVKAAKLAAVDSLSLYGISIGMTTADVTRMLGKPVRIDPSSIGVEWWIYNRDLNQYLQVGIQNNKVVTLFSNGAAVSLKGVKIGSPASELAKHWGEPTATLAVTPYLKIQENSLTEQPSYLAGEQVFTFSIDRLGGGKVAGIRISSPDHFATIALRLGYPVVYSKLPALPTLADAQLVQAALAAEKENLDLTNIARLRAGLPLLGWNPKLADTARAHSLDMVVNKYFDHNSPVLGSPFDRMKKAGIAYGYAGENIAADQLDGVAVHYAWMNSAGHRSNILEPRYTKLGVGVIMQNGKSMYTQNFILAR